MILFHVFKQLNVRNRAYVIDNKGNKLFYGTVYQCRKFIEYMEGVQIMNKPLKTILLPNGKSVVEWTKREKPSVNHWYLCKDSDTDYWKIMKDYYSPETKQTYYKIVEYYNGYILYCGHTLSQICEIMRDNTYRMVI